MRGVSTSLLVISLLGLPAAARAQADSPAPVSNAMPASGFGFNLPTHLGTLTYSLSGSEMLETTSEAGASVDSTTALSGNLGYLSTSQRYPFSMIYSGGLFFTSVPGSSSTETFQDLAVSQVAQSKSWVFVVSDSLSYLPGAPTTGLSGVAGVGDVGVFPVQTGIGPDQSILTSSGTRIANGVQGSATWQTTPSLDLEASGAWQVLHFTGGVTALNTDTTSANFGPNYRIDARTSVGADVNYSDTTFPSYAGYKIETEGANVSFSRAWTRRVSTTVNLGPSRTRGTTFAPIPSKWIVAGTAQANYATRTTGFYAIYTRGVSSGSGIIFGSLTDSILAGITRPLTRDWNLGMQVSYSRNVGLSPVNGLIPRYDSVFGAVQLARRITESLSCYGSYTGISQSSVNPFYLNTAFNGTNNVFGFGITFAPAPRVSGR